MLDIINIVIVSVFKGVNISCILESLNKEFKYYNFTPIIQA
jgi:hypothetical protein